MSPRGAERGNVGNIRKKRVARTKHWRRGRKGPGGTQVPCKGGELQRRGAGGSAGARSWGETPDSVADKDKLLKAGPLANVAVFTPPSLQLLPHV